jgi:hypothetical protein
MRPSYEDGHLVVAAARVLAHRSDKPPTPEQIADLLGLAPDFVRTVVIGLGEEGVLKVVDNPFEIRVEVADHGKLETLPREAQGPTIGDELDSFITKKQQEYEATEKMLSMDEIEKKRKAKMSKLDKEMKKMKRPHSPLD